MGGEKLNLSSSTFVLILEELGGFGARAIEPELEGVPSKEGLMVPDAWIRVCVGLKGIKSINKTAFDGAASKKVAVAMPATPNDLTMILVKFILIMNF
jgi:hypothetical protein